MDGVVSGRKEEEGNGASDSRGDDESLMLLERPEGEGG